MKHALLLICPLFLTAGPASAQTVLTAGSTMPIVGLSNIVYDCSQFSPGTAGAAQTWDMSKLPFKSGLGGNYQACTATNGCTGATGATIAYSWGSMWEYYNTSGSKLSMVGFRNPSMQLYTNEEDYLRFPFKYGDSFVDSFASTYSGSKGLAFRRGNDSVSADGWGTLKTPSGSFPNTLRVKNISTYQDSLMMDPVSKTRYKVTTYWFYDAGHRNFLYTTASIVSKPFGGAQQTVSYARYTDSQPFAVTGAASNGPGCSIVQNPARDQVQVIVSLDAAARVSASLSDLTGRTVSGLPLTDLAGGSSKLSIPARGLPAGVYTLRIMAGEGTTAMKVVLE